MFCFTNIVHILWEFEHKGEGLLLHVGEPWACVGKGRQFEVHRWRGIARGCKALNGWKYLHAAVPICCAIGCGLFG